MAGLDHFRQLTIRAILDPVYGHKLTDQIKDQTV